MRKSARAAPRVRVARAGESVLDTRNGARLRSLSYLQSSI